VTPVIALILICFAALVMVELLIRLLGITSFALFAKDDRCHYRMKAAQRGRFLNRYQWSYDERGMRTKNHVSTLSGAVILLGDSVVDGGNYLTQSDTLAERLQGAIGKTVYPIACNGWSIGNELAALTSMPSWQDADKLIVVLNTGDFNYTNEGSSPWSFPSRLPLWLLPWLICRQLYRRYPAWWPPERPAPTAEAVRRLRDQNLTRFKDVVEQFRGTVSILRFPLKGEDPAKETYFETLAAVAKSKVSLIDIIDSPLWTDDCYRDNIHPNSTGVDVLSRCIQEKLF
jgi:hypothetical protein